MNLETHLPALLRRARALLNLSGGPERELAKNEIAKAAAAVSALHEGLIDDRPLARPETYAGKALGAYLLWWWPQTYAKTRALLRMAHLAAPRTIVDAGSGPGPAATAALDAFPEAKAIAIDASRDALSEAKAIDPRLEILAQDVTKPLPPSDLLIAANVLVETPLQLESAPNLLLIEPALRETGRELLKTRDKLLQQGYFALAPCLTQQPCPALVHAKDWCTLEDRWTPPPHVKQLADATGLRADELLSYAGVVLSKTAPAPRDLWRVVGIAPPEKGKKRVWLCGPVERIAAARLQRDASEANARFDELKRGDLVKLGATERRGDGLRVGKETSVERE